MQVFGVESLYCSENATKKCQLSLTFCFVLGTLLGTLGFNGSFNGSSEPLFFKTINGFG